MGWGTIHDLKKTFKLLVLRLKPTLGAPLLRSVHGALGASRLHPITLVQPTHNGAGHIILWVKISARAGGWAVRNTI